MLDQASFLEHLEALRRTILGNLLVLAVGIVPAAVIVHTAMPWLLQTLAVYIPGCRFHYFTPLEPFFLELKLVLAADFLLGLPVHLCLWGNFLAPALYLHERKTAFRLLTAATALFVCGAALALCGVMPLLLRFSAGFATAEWQPVLTLGSVLGMALMLLLGFGAAFQLPIVLLLLVRGGMAKTADLKKKRPAVLVTILVFSAILTPPDVLSQCLMAIPAYLLFEMALWIAVRWEKNASRRENKAIPPEAAPAPSELPEPPPAILRTEEFPPAQELYIPPTVYDRARRGIRMGRPRNIRNIRNIRKKR